MICFELVGDRGGGIPICHVKHLECDVTKHTLSRSVLVILDDARQAEISDFAQQAVGDEDVGSPQVSVNVVFLLDVGHALGDLRPQRQTDLSPSCVGFCKQLNGA